MKSSHFRKGSPAPALVASAKAGFTLVELLVVIAIIGVLVAILLPAVQAAREAARRMQCSNNLKQLALGVCNYESAHKVFPSGALFQWRASWLIAVLPFTEETVVADRLNPIEGAYPFWNTNYGTGYNNTQVLSNYSPPFLHCPSSTLPHFTDWSAPQLMATSNYVGVSGAVTNATTFNDPTGQRRCADGPFGFSCSNGMLVPNLYVRGRLVLDGLSKTFLISEQSDWIISAVGTPIDRRSSDCHGAWIGASSPGWPENDVWGSVGDVRYYNCATLRFPIGTKTDAGAGAGMAYCAGATNMPVQSVHGGGVFAARCDGSVSFLADDTEWVIQRSFFIRDDAQVGGE